MKTIIVLTDFSAEAMNAADWAIMLAVRLQADVMLFNCYSSVRLPIASEAEWPVFEDDRFQLESEAALNQEARRLYRLIEDSHPAVRPQIYVRQSTGPLADRAADLEAERKPILTLMGSRRGTHTQLRFGSDTHELIDRSCCPILIIPDKVFCPENLSGIVLATDLELSDLHALAHLQSLTSNFNCPLHVCHVSRPVLIPDFREEDRLAHFRSAVTMDSNKHTSFTALRADDVLTQLEKFVQAKQADILAVIHRRHSFIWRTFKGSMTKSLNDRQQFPLLVLPEK